MTDQKRDEGATMSKGADLIAAERATILDMANAILEARAGQIGTHYETCWMNHVGCFAARIQLALAKEKTP